MQEIHLKAAEVGKKFRFKLLSIQPLQRKSNSKFGAKEEYLYHVEHEGQQCYLVASSALSQQISRWNLMDTVLISMQKKSNGGPGFFYSIEADGRSGGPIQQTTQQAIQSVQQAFGNAPVTPQQAVQQAIPIQAAPIQAQPQPQPTVPQNAPEPISDMKKVAEFVINEDQARANSLVQAQDQAQDPRTADIHRQFAWKAGVQVIQAIGVKLNPETTDYEAKKVILSDIRFYADAALKYVEDK